MHTSGRGPARSLTPAFSFSPATIAPSKGTAKSPPPCPDVLGGALRSGKGRLILALQQGGHPLAGQQGAGEANHQPQGVSGVKSMQPSPVTQVPGHTCLWHPSSDLHSSGPAGTIILHGAVITAFSFKARLVMPPICVLCAFAVHSCHIPLSVCLSVSLLLSQVSFLCSTKQNGFRSSFRGWQLHLLIPPPPQENSKLAANTERPSSDSRGREAGRCERNIPGHTHQAETQPQTLSWTAGHRCTDHTRKA